MSQIIGIIRNGQIILPRPAELPDGTKVAISPLPRARNLGIRDEDWPTDPEVIARHLAIMDQVQPFEMTEEERADIAAWREQVKKYTIASMDKGIEGLFQCPAIDSTRRRSSS